MLIPNVYSTNKQFTSVGDLKLNIIEESGKIEGQILNNKSMKDRIFNLISSKGGNTKF